jgi:hypothetical protein
VLSKMEATTMTAMKSNTIHATLGSSTWGFHKPTIGRMHLQQ